MGRELTEDTIPGEGGQRLIDLSVSFTKGCYTGQELVARIDSRGGNVPRPVRVLAADGEPGLVGGAGGTPDTDVWPGSQSDFGPSSVPGSRLWDGSESGVTVSSISAISGGSVSLFASVTNLSSEIALPFARPNPFRPELHGSTGLVLALGGNAATTRVTVHDVRGRLVRTLNAGSDFSASDNVVYWDGIAEDGSVATAGVYVFRQETDGGTPGSGRFVLLR